MRILHVVPSYLPAVRYGGPIFTVHGLCRALAARGHELQVFTTNTDGAGTTPTPIGTPVELDGIQIRYFSCPLLKRLYWAPALGRALRHEIGKVDIVHLHSVFLWPTWAAARAARNAGVPYVLSPRGMLVKDLINRRSRLVKSAWIHLIERSNVEQAAALHLTSQLEGSEVERFGWRLPRLAVIPNAIDEPISQSGKIASDVEAITSEQPLVLFLGRLTWKKGLDRLLHAFARTQSGILAIVGTDDENFAPQLVKLAQSCGLRIEFAFCPAPLLDPTRSACSPQRGSSCYHRIRKTLVTRCSRQCDAAFPWWSRLKWEQPRSFRNQARASSLRGIQSRSVRPFTC